MPLQPAHLAQRSADPLRLSVTCDTLPPRRAYYRYDLGGGHWLIVVRHGITYGALARAYARGRAPAWARARMWVPLGVVDPADDLAAYHRRRWWGEEWETSHTAAQLLEDAAGPDLITRWPHAWLLDPVA